MDFTPVPRTDKTADGQITATIQINEGPQYRIDLLEITADEQEITEELTRRWELKSGVPFDANYVDRFLQEISDSLPTDFSHRNDLAVVRDCRDRTVDVYILMDSKRSFWPRPQDVSCDVAER